MSASYPPPANKSCRIWTERDDELPAFMADMLATASNSEVLEAGQKQQRRFQADPRAGVVNMLTRIMRRARQSRLFRGRVGPSTSAPAIAFDNAPMGTRTDFVAAILASRPLPQTKIEWLRLEVDLREQFGGQRHYIKKATTSDGKTAKSSMFR